MKTKFITCHRKDIPWNITENQPGYHKLVQNVNMLIVLRLGPLTGTSHRQRGRSPIHCNVQGPTRLQVGAKNSIDTKCLSHHLLPPKIWKGRKLELGAIPGFEPCTLIEGAHNLTDRWSANRPPSGLSGINHALPALDSHVFTMGDRVYES